MSTYLGLLDCNNFFVSCERLFRPDLARVPVVVLSSNDGCVVARSAEVKDKGIPMGVPYFQVKDSLKDMQAVCFSSHFALYRDISQRVFTVMRRLVPHLEQYSIDEAFFTFTAASPAAAATVGRELKHQVERLVGVPVSVGISDTKTRAKLVSAAAKRTTGVLVAAGADFLPVFGERPIGEVWGVGGQSERRYRAAGVRTVADLVALTTSAVTALGNMAGQETQAELVGVVVHPVTLTRQGPQSLTSTRSFRTKTTSRAAVNDAVAYHVSEVTRSARAAGMVAGVLTVLLGTARHGAFMLRGGTAPMTLTVPTADTATCVKVALAAVDTLYEPGVVYSKAGVTLSALCPAALATTSLFAASDHQPAAATLDGVLDALTARFGRGAVAFGRHEQTRTWTARQQAMSPAYTTRWQELRTVRAV